jgi:hypothetical protein
MHRHGEEFHPETHKGSDSAESLILCVRKLRSMLINDRLSNSSFTKTHLLTRASPAGWAQRRHSLWRQAF